jgi:hypothetical protein
VEIRGQLKAILDPEYLADIASLSTDEIRAMRRDCEIEEHGISYARRVIQGKLDIVRAEAIRRRDETGESDLLGSLPSVLGDRAVTTPQSHRAVRLLPPPEAQPYVQRAEALGERAMASLRTLPDGDIADLASELAEAEHELSELRHQVFERIDALQNELMKRYKSGTASVREVLPS